MEKDSERPLLLAASAADDDGAYSPDHHYARGQTTTITTLRRRLLRPEVSLILNVVFLALSCALWLPYYISRPGSLECQGVFTPAHEAIEYTTKVFRSGLVGDRTEYQGPTEEVQQKWKALYEHKIAMTGIDAATAQKLPNATAPSSFDPEQYVVQLDVFHTLHCLNLLRQRLYPDVYPVDNRGDNGTPHLEHCVESIRQSLQCFSDVSTLYWEWDDEVKRMLGNTKTTHTCRNFEKIQDWAREHSLEQETDFLVYVPGAPLKKGD